MLDLGKIKREPPKPPRKSGGGWINELVGALCDPIIVYPSGWQDTLPEWIKPQITLERLLMHAKVMREGGVPVGDTEALAYIYPRTMEAPMPEQWYRIYMYVFNQAMKFKKTEVPSDLKSENLSDYDMNQLNDLKQWIYKKRVEHRREKARRTDLESREIEKPAEITPVQCSLF